MSFGSFLKQSLKEQLGSWDDFTNGFSEGFFGADYLRDYQHASKTFNADGQALAPTNKFLFHVFFTLNTAEIPGLAKAMGGAEGNSRIGILCKTAQLPQYTFDTSTLNQYNRKRIVQTKINYDPVQISFHDDGSDTIRTMWFNYYNYYYRDTDYGYDGRGANNPAYNIRDIYEELRGINDWGYSGRGPNGLEKPAFFKDIKIYGLNRGNFTSYTLINPMITNWSHDTFDYTQGNGTMQHNVQISYEAVKYGRGKVGREVKGFGDQAVYDTTPSPLRAGTRATLFGQGGILDAGGSILEDLASGNILGAIRTGGSLRNALKGTNVTQLISSELVSSAISTGLNFLSNNGSRSNSIFSIPSFGSNLNFGSVGGSITNMATGMFNTAGFTSLNSSFSNVSSTSFSFGNISQSMNSLANQFAPGTELNSDYVSFFNNLKSNLEPGMSVLENVAQDVASSIDTSTLPSVTNLVNDIPGEFSLDESLTSTLETASKSFAPIAQDLGNTFKSAVNSNEFQNLTDKFKNSAGDVFSNGSNIGI